MSDPAAHTIAHRLLVDELSDGQPIAEEIIHPAFFDHTNPPGMQEGVAGHKAIVALFRAAFPDGRWDIEDLICEGDKIVARTTFRGTHGGDFFGIPPTGKRVEMGGVHIMRVAEGRVAEHWGSNDDLGMMRQLGVVPA